MGKIPVRRICERFYPAAFAIIGGVFAFRFDLRFESDKYSNQLSSTINVSAILMGFLGTAQAMLLSFNTKTFRGIRANKYLWALMLGYFRSALLASLALCVFSLILFSVDTSHFNAWKVGPVALEGYLAPVWIALAIYAFFSFYRVVRVVFLLLNDPSVGTNST
ncbi:hypothetical protein L0Z42_11105 [Burkholderia multivorans]|uniref:hypothetical protein n=2 Tax=Burkholderia multivorans TaxID=87883 RepID=UPI0005B7E8D2|nr:hypothetical protein [Burkholderia multivorans]MBU9317410.1 hypothetical protein [Burkholderia multivorans]MCA8249374.1 hypothetical protein [Burkholderia multivorans]MCA8376820.1 hypothetical protein [Burkholderia multivorans]MCL4625329.1 hypothetical protein [Burkholderia multivorans]MCO1371099.1 hypothetical protein [Burkholderia multivorans]